MPRDSDANTGHVGSVCDGRPVTDGGTARARADDSEDMLAALISFLVPGVGHLIVDDKQDRGVAILIAWIVWLVIGWGGFGLVGFFIVSTLLTLLTLGFGAALVPFLIPIWILVLGAIELVIHALAAVDAYRQSQYVDRVTDRVNEYR